MASTLVPLGIMAVSVALGLWMSSRARILAIPALLGFGVAMGSTGVGLLPETPFLHQSTELGLILMLFFTSFLGSPRALKDGGGIGLPLAAYDLVVNFGVAWWIGRWLDWGPREILFLAGIMASSSSAVALKILGDEGRIARREGNVLVSLLMIEDWVFLGFFAFLGMRYGDTAHTQPLMLLAGVVGFALFLVGLRLARRWIWRISRQEVLLSTVTAIGIAGAYLGMLAGLPGVGAAFTTGLVLSGGNGARLVRDEAPFLREAAAAIFFCGYGALLGPGLSLAILPVVGLCLAGVLVTEILFLPVLARRLGLRRSEAFVTGAILLPRGGKSAAFGRLYPTGPGTKPLFPIAGLLAVVLTPLTPLLVKIGLYFARSPTRLSVADPSEAFSRHARGLLIPHAYRQRLGADVWDLVVLIELMVLGAGLGLLTLLMPIPWRVIPAAAAATLIPFLAASLRRVVRRIPGSPQTTHPRRVARHFNAAFDHVAWVLTGPLALLLGLAVLSPWALVAYPILLGGVWVLAMFTPWMRHRPRTAPSLGRALGS